MLQAVSSARAVRFGETAAEAVLLRDTVRRQQVEIANLKLALAHSEREKVLWRDKWTAEVCGRHRCPALDDILNLVCEWFDASKVEVLSNRRTAEVMEVRHIAMYVSKEITLRSFPVIGKYFRREHSSVIHAHRKIAAKVRHDLQFAATVKAIIERAKELEAKR